ncbi:actin-crosslinking protein [Westerdykella ornata]|uniref:Actin-crosslinking protein n=1 Tax=Westerdykella ornata TaxID=318751 RepID=A0A6A6JB87_WESOR|nr:actin-crosslinking protein [Westerdykella ornata]KAF2273464.1 actin-crosslinking protein [Westerdykella ornata]
MPTPLHFKGDKKTKKRKRVPELSDADVSAKYSDSSAVTTTKKDINTAEPHDDDSWVSAEVPSDISGPIIVVLPTEPASCLACDANGSVFTLPIENFVDGDPATAEPHDVRQVWVANRVAGTESLSLKGHHGKYLSCDKYGLLTATATAISPAESFLCIPVPDNPATFTLQTARDTFLTVDSSSASAKKTSSSSSSSSKSTTPVRGDAESISFNTTFRIRMQARFKPKLKASKQEKAQAKITRAELEKLVGRRLDEDEVRKLKRARREGNFHEEVLDIKVKSSHDKFAS